MNADVFKGAWKQAKGKVKEVWADMTDDEVSRIDGDYDKFVGTIQTKYGYTKEDSRSKVNEFLKRFNKPEGQDRTI
jgi:uncharacterized protein YjbJ (UPF0337 family)